jgi:hypothetical protein
MLWMAIAAGAVLRLTNLDYMEFKGDEFRAMIRAHQNLHGDIALVGLPSTAGPDHPALLVHLVSIPMLLTTDPVAVTAFIALLNVAGLALLYLALRRINTDLALWTTALMASAPWAIVLSRKIWQPDIVFPFLALFLFCYVAYLQQGRRWQLWATFLAVALLTQTHLIALFVMPAFVLSLWLNQAQVQRADALIGSGIFLLLYAPYAAHYALVEAGGFAALVEGADGGLASPIEGLKWSLALSTGLRFHELLGRDGVELFASRYYQAAPMLVFTAFAGSAAAALILHLPVLRRIVSERGKAPLGEKLIGFLLIAFAVTIAATAVLGDRAHYYVITYPTLALVFAGAVLRIDDARFRALGKAFLLVVVALHIWFSASLQTFVVNHPEEIRGLYGVPYALYEDEWRRALDQVLKDAE